MTISSTESIACPRCEDTAVIREVISGPHKFQAWCEQCQRSIKWVGADEPRKSRRGQAKLVRDFSEGYCELCLRCTADVPGRGTLEAHHIIEKHEGGSVFRENIWILCTACHSHVHWARTYMNDHHKEN